MTRSDLLNTSALRWVLSGFCFAAMPAFAQETEVTAPTDPISLEEEGDLERMTVTGSLIQGTPEDTALPVDITTRDDLLALGSPSLVEFIRNLGVSSGIDGETNQFTSNGLEGSSNINLRGLGPARTLVLINGRRQVVQPFALAEQAQLFVDTNQIPVSAIGRIEILKEGAGVTYGSDAIAGVANIITRTDLDGFEIGGDYSYIDGSNGDYTAFASYGKNWERTRVFATFGYQHRSELTTLDREDFAVRPFEEVGANGGWSLIGNPGTFVALTDLAAGNFIPRPDAQCETLGATNAGGFCRFQFTPFDNLVEIEDRFQFFGEVEHQLPRDITWRTEFLWAKTEVPEWNTSPSYPPQELFGQVVPATHPGLIQYVEDNPDQAVLAPGAIFIGRTFGFSGFPDQGPQIGSRERASYRVSSEIFGEDHGINWNFAVTYARARAEVITPDTFIVRLENALQGLGGFECDPLTGTPGAGPCEYYNPFSNAVQQNVITGDVNPQFNPALANSNEIADFLTGNQELRFVSNLFVLDATFSGDTGFSFWGDNITWGAGFQYRIDEYEANPGDLSNLAVRPCPAEGDFTCDSPTGPFAFLAAQTAFEDDQDVYAIFGEFQVPVTEDLNLTVAARFEDYGGEVGSTFDPKFSALWAATDFLSFRGSVQTTFRAPTLNQLAGQNTTLQFVGPANAFRAVDQFGNPDLEPESAFTFNVGALLNLGNFSATVDYWSFDFDDPIIVEAQEAIVAAAFADIAAGNTDTAIVQRLTFDGGIIDPARIARIETNVVNGPTIKTSGIDASAEYLFENLGPGDLTLSGSVTYNIEYEVDDQFIEGVLVQPQFDAVGQLNRSNFLRSLPQWKANISLNYAWDIHNFLAVVRHTDSYEDERNLAFFETSSREIDSWTTLDLHYNVNLPYDIRFNISAINVTDEDPPFARLDLNYDPYQASPVGRILKFGIIKRFGPQ